MYSAYNISQYVANLDYTPLNEWITFKNSQKQCVNIEIIDDNIVEPTEQFNVLISSSTDPNLVLEDDHTVVSIKDNDVLYVSGVNSVIISTL